MARVRVRDGSALEWRVFREIAPIETHKEFSEAEMCSPFVFYEEGTETAPQLFAVKLPPNAEINVHSHQADEIIYVVAGEMIVGNRHLGPGSAVSVKGGTLYGFSAGPEGLHILNFRPHIDLTYYTPEQHRSMRGGKQAIAPSGETALAD